MTATAVLEALIEVVPYKIHTVLTDNSACSRIAAKVGPAMPDLRRFAPADRDNGVRFCYLPSKCNGPTARYFRHMFDMRCQENGIEHRLTKPNHPWTKRNLVERFFNKIKNYRGIATRYDKKAMTFLAAIKLVAVRLCLKSYEATL